MFRSRYFGQRYFSSNYHDGGIPTAKTSSSFFKSNYFRSRSVSGSTFFSGLQPGIPTIPVSVGSIAIEVLPNSVARGSPVTVIAYVYDNFNKPMEGVTVFFNSSSPAVLSVPAPGASDSLGRVVKTANTFTTGTTNLSATVNGYTAYTTVVVTSAVGGVSSSLTHGATIQPGNAGGGSPGPIRVKLVKKVKRWPTM